MKPTDVLVVGSGMAGLMAALSAAARGKTVRIAARGAGALAISGGSVDLLGYVNGKAVTGNPLDAMEGLAPEHPYRIMGRKAVTDALDFFLRLCRGNGLELKNHTAENHWIPTILGTFKPTFLCAGSGDRAVIDKAQSVIIPYLPWLKDCHAGMAQELMREKKRFAGKEFHIPRLRPPQPSTHRNLTALDMARFVETPEGESWLREELAPHVSACSGGCAVLLPPVLGIDHHCAVHERLGKFLGCSLLEMVVPPPGVGGLRIRRTLMRALAGHGVLVTENAHITAARVEGKRCLSLVCDAPDRKREIAAEQFVIATGGFFGGGHTAVPGIAKEAIFGIDLRAPATVEAWSTPDVFATQPFACLGIKADRDMRPLSPDGENLLENVFFAGRSLGGYDFAVEKSGNGVALCSGYVAGLGGNV